MNKLMGCPLCDGVAQYVQPPMGDPSFIRCIECGLRLDSINIMGKNLVEFWNCRKQLLDTMRLLEQRDIFIVENGLWGKFVDEVSCSKHTDTEIKNG